MSGGTIAHRILSRTAGKSVRVGEEVEAAQDRAVLSGTRVPSALVQVRDRGRPWSAEDLLLTMDFQAPEVESQIPRSRALCRELAEDFGLRRVLDLNMGIGSHVVVEEGLITPGQLVVGCGRCLGVTGGIGVLGLRLAEAELTQAIVTGRTSLPVPAAVRVEVKGRLPRPTGPWDVAGAVLGLLGDSLAGRVVEFGGDTEAWGIDFRIGVCGLVSEMGALAALVTRDEVVEKFYRERGVSLDDSEQEDGYGEYETEVALNAESVVAVTGQDYSGPHHPLPREGGEAVQGVFIGSCYGGRYDDLALVAEVLKKKGHVHPDVRLTVSPATLETARACLAAGFYETFLQAGAMIAVPGGGPGNAGGGAIFGDGERIASTAEYHRHLHPGQGVPEVHLLSPSAAAVAAAEGLLVAPQAFLA